MNTNIAAKQLENILCLKCPSKNISGSSFIGIDYISDMHLTGGKSDCLVDGGLYNDSIEGLPYKSINNGQGGLDINNITGLHINAVDYRV